MIEGDFTLRMDQDSYRAALIEGLRHELPGWAGDYAFMCPDQVRIRHETDGGVTLEIHYDDTAPEESDG